jgi:REP element-mobilizing transposase RayT
MPPSDEPRRGDRTHARGDAVPQSFTCLHYHLVWSTKHREPTITPDLRPRLYEYLGGIVRSEGGMLLTVGGVADHVHLLARLSQQTAVADLLRVAKANSTKWVHDTFPTSAGFGWQTGYGAFTVSYSQLDAVRHYIARQEEHHRTVTFQDEFREFLRRHGIEFDERYLWE